jgi:hypothetical protein
MGIFAITLIIGAASLAMAGVPDVNNCTATRAYTGPEKLVVEVVPGGSADNPIDEAVVFVPAQPNPPGTGVTQTIQDGTITVTVMDGAVPPVAIVNYPRQDVWLVNTGNPGEAGLLPCTGGATADDETDVNGVTEFRNPVSGGGYTTALTTVIINGNAVPGTINLSFNSPDSNGDGFINGIDLQAFSADFYGYALVPPPSTYNFRGDLFFDGVVTGADLQNFASHFGKTCD